MTIQKLLEEIGAITDEEIAAAELSEDEDGVEVGKPIEDRFLMQVATLYYREQEAINLYYDTTDTEDSSPSEFVAERGRGLRLGLLGDIFDYHLHLHYGQFVSQEDVVRHVTLEVRAGWSVSKVFNDNVVEEDEDDETAKSEESDESLGEDRPRLLN
jgi:hypothetical protein